MKILKSFVITLLIFSFVAGMFYLIGNYPIIAISIMGLLLFVGLWADLYESM